MLFRSPPWDSVVYWALDLETGGLDPVVDPILAVGMVPIRGGKILLRESYRSLVRPEPGSSVNPASIEAHQLVSRDLQQAPALADVIPEIERRLREGVLLVHHGVIEVAFLRRDFQRTRVAWPSLTVVDTEALLVRAERLRDPRVSKDLMALNLSEARTAHGLPAYQAHDALSDALATAELFLFLRLALGARTIRDLR